jgi:hypothetical protein
MRLLIILFFFISISTSTIAQALSGMELLDKSIEYHDPNSKWNQFNGSFSVSMESPNRPMRKSKITLDLTRSFFELSVQIGENQWKASLVDEDCDLFFNGSKEISPEVEKEFRLNCKRSKMYRNYYTYLYGLPMKLKDPGTLIDPIINQKSIEGTSYWVLKVEYEPNVGSDTWYFYFDIETFALKRYQFFHDESKNDGEYIILDGEIEIEEILMPKNRSWYYNSDNTFLGTDILSKQ